LRVCSPALATHLASPLVPYTTLFRSSGQAAGFITQGGGYHELGDGCGHGGYCDAGDDDFGRGGESAAGGYGDQTDGDTGAGQRPQWGGHIEGQQGCGGHVCACPGRQAQDIWATQRVASEVLEQGQ